MATQEVHGKYLLHIEDGTYAEVREINQLGKWVILASGPLKHCRLYLKARLLDDPNYKEWKELNDATRS